MKYRILNHSDYGFFVQIRNIFTWQDAEDSRGETLYFKTLFDAERFVEEIRKEKTSKITIVDTGLL